MSNFSNKHIKKLLENVKKSKNRKKQKKSEFTSSEFQKTFNQKSEQQEQEELCLWIKDKYPDVIYTVDLAGLNLSPVQMKIYKSRAKRGHPDLIIQEWAQDKFPAIAIEFKKTGTFLDMKTIENDDHLSEQLEYIYDLRKRGRLAGFVVGVYNAKKVVSLYLEGTKESLRKINYFMFPKHEELENL